MKKTPYDLTKKEQKKIDKELKKIINMGVKELRRRRRFRLHLERPI